METLTRAGTCSHATVRISSQQPVQFFDVTDRVERLVADAGIRTGLVNVQTLHTTTAVVVNEGEPRLLVDVEALLGKIAPADGRYRHDDPNTGVSCLPQEKPNGHAHCRAVLLPFSATLNVVDGRLRLGRWQRVFLVELDGPRQRELSVVLFGDAGQ